MALKMPSVKGVKHKVEEIGDVHLPHWTSLLLWIVGILVMVGLTIRYIRPICNNYFNDDENVSVNIGVESNFTESHYPSVYACVPTVYSEITKELLESLKTGNTTGCEVCRKLEQHSWDVWKDVDMSNISTAFSAEFNKLIIDRLFSNLTDFQLEIDHKDSHDARGHWQLIIYEQIFQYFHTAYYSDDDFFSQGKLVDEETLPFDGKTYHWKQPWDVQSHRDDRDIDELFRKVTEFYCRFFTWGPLSVFPLFVNETFAESEAIAARKCVDYLQQTGAFIHPVGRLFCTKLPFSSEQLDQTHGIGSRVSYYDILRDNRGYWPMITLYTHTKILDDGIPSMPNFFYQSRENQNGQFEVVHISYSLQATVYEEREQIKKKCYEDKSKLDCVVRCKAQKVRQECQCVPFTARSLVDKGNLTYCNQRKYDACGKKAFDRFAECQSECTYACQYDIYQWQVVISPNRPNHTAVSIELGSYAPPYLRFNVSNRDGIEDLIAQVGGLFNFYLGCSGLSVIFVLVYAWDCYRRWKAAKTVGDSGSSLHTTMQWRWLTSSSADRSKIRRMEATIEQLQRRLDAVEASQRRTTKDAVGGTVYMHV